MITEALPFKPCPDTPNCYITKLELKRHVAKVKVATSNVLQSMGAKQILPLPTGFDAVFQVFIFLDDVTIRITGSDDTPTLWIRSASRVGHSDLGVNKRRVSDFLHRLQKELS
jgi:uncharacterized protein (DUF1499 family)